MKWPDVAELYESGLTTYEIGERLGMHPTSISYRLRAMGVAIRTRAEQGDVRVEKDRLPRFMRLVHKDANGCWTWLGHLSKTGYANCYVHRQTVLAHRWFYERLVRPIPDRLTLDHLCRNRACVNPDHLEPVTMRENALRGVGPTAINARRTHCKHGHELAGDNLRLYRGKRQCRECQRPASLRSLMQWLRSQVDGHTRNGKHHARYHLHVEPMQLSAFG